MKTLSIFLMILVMMLMVRGTEVYGFTSLDLIGEYSLVGFEIEIQWNSRNNSE